MVYPFLKRNSWHWNNYKANRPPISVLFISSWEDWVVSQWVLSSKLFPMHFSCTSFLVILMHVIFVYKTRIIPQIFQDKLGIFLIFLSIWSLKKNYPSPIASHGSMLLSYIKYLCKQSIVSFLIIWSGDAAGPSKVSTLSYAYCFLLANFLEDT